MLTQPRETTLAAVSVRKMREADLPDVRRILRVAFGTFVGAPNPEEFFPDREYVSTRWLSAPEAALVAVSDGQVVGSNFVTVWGSFGFFGPLTVRPDLWNQRIAQALLGPTMDLFAQKGVKEAGLFTFAHSTKHISLYQKFGFWPRYLTAIMSKTPARSGVSASAFSSLTTSDQEHALHACRNLTNDIYEGLDVSSEIQSVNEQRLGDTLLLWDGDSLDAFAVCHCGEGTEAGRDNCYVKFAAVQPGKNAGTAFESLMDACETFAVERGLTRVDAGVNLNRSRAYRQMLQRGFRTHVSGVAMHRPDSPGYNGPDVFVLDDWR